MVVPWWSSCWRRRSCYFPVYAISEALNYACPSRARILSHLLNPNLKSSHQGVNRARMRVMEAMQVNSTNPNPILMSPVSSIAFALFLPFSPRRANDGYVERSVEGEAGDDWDELERKAAKCE